MSERSYSQVQNEIVPVKNVNLDDLSLNDVEFGVILTDLIETESITDIDTRGYEIWVTDIHSVPHKVDLSKYKPLAIEEFRTLLEKIPRQIAMQMQTSFNANEPFLDGEWRYKDKGQIRVSAIHGSMVSDGINTLALRVTPFGLRIDSRNIYDDDYATPEFIKLMMALINAGCNIFIMGLTGAGKTELLRYLARYIRHYESIITMEDTLEADLKGLYPSKHIMALKTTDGFGYTECLRPCLRQNPDWILVSETRGKEVIDLLESVSTGHKIITTVHGDSAANLPNRIIDMAKVDGVEANRIFRQVHSYIDIAIYIHYYNDEKGSHRQIAEVAEFYLDKQGKPQSHYIFEKDYVHDTYKYEPIRSSRIKMKLARSKTNTNDIRGVFLSEQD